MGFWVYLTFVLLALTMPWISVDWHALSLALTSRVPRTGKPADRADRKEARAERRRRWRTTVTALGIAFLPITVALIGLLFSSTVFNARRYASVISINDAVFEEDMPEANEITNIALMDTASAQILGNRTLGSLSELVSQYDVSESYTQINYGGAPKKVATLEYESFFKWMTNSGNGIPGLVMVDPVNSGAEYIQLDEPIYYSASAYFGQDLMRKLRTLYPTKIFDSVMFEVDEECNPYYIVSCVKPRVGWFGALDVSEVIIFNPCDGTGTLYPVGEVPSWVDIAYTGDLACRKYDWLGKLSGGWLNSIFSNKGCKQTTDDFGYIALGDDVWYFTGVTSVTADKSNIGFILSNARTGEYKYYPVIGAEEHSAMSAAQGEVQEKGYVASFPSLINVSGNATYIMVLKDDAGLVKLYALVKVQNYSIVATGTTQAEAMSAYRKLLAESGSLDGEVRETIMVENVRLATVSGVSTVYITATDGKVYKGYLESDESLILVRIGDVLSVAFTESGTEGINIISSWKHAPTDEPNSDESDTSESDTSDGEE